MVHRPPRRRRSGGSISNGPPVDGQFPTVSLPVLSSGPDLLGWLEEKGWFLISDVAGILRGLTIDLAARHDHRRPAHHRHGLPLWHTPFGLRLRAAGEKPGAADSLGVSVIRMRYYGMVLSGAMAGLGGAVLVFPAPTATSRTRSPGSGFLGLAALVFGNWMPAGTLAGAGRVRLRQGITLQHRRQHLVRALILAVGIALALFAIVVGRQRNVDAPL